MRWVGRDGSNLGGEQDTPANDLRAFLCGAVGGGIGEKVGAEN